MKCLVKVGFAGITYSSAPGKTIDLPIIEARSLQSQGIVEIIDDYKPEIAYETAEQVTGQKAMKPIGKRK